MLTFGYNLTILDVSLPASWFPKGQVPPGLKSAPPPGRPKGYVPGKPSSELVAKVTSHHFILDAVIVFLPNLRKLGWSGPQASTNIFALMPASLAT